MTEDGRQSLVQELLAAAVLAGSYSSLARELPEAARGLGRMREKHHERVTALSGQICAAGELDARPAAPMPNRQSR